MTAAETRLVAVKRLSAVEVDPEASHQREFHASRLRRELDFPEAGASGPLTALVYGTGDEPVIDETTYALYQARKPPRSEFHLYPRTDIFRDHARAGDLLILYREPGSDALHAVVAHAGSDAEQQLLDAVFAREIPDLTDFAFVAPPSPTESSAAEIAEALTRSAQVVPDIAITDHPLYARALEERDYPRISEMASAAFYIVESAGAPADADDLLMALLGAETALFFAIENELAGSDLRVMLDSSADLTAVLDFAMRRFQSRKARRGASLQNHLAYVLTRERIPHTQECTPESPPPADFMIPSCDAYHDAAFPAASLRMVSCKTTTRERWYETIPESQRIELKYLLTLDEEMSTQKITDMWNASVRPFLPRQIIESAYAGRPLADRLSTVAQLVGELRSALGEGT